MKQLAIAYVLFVAACGGKASGTTTDPCADPCKDKSGGAPDIAEVVTLDSLENGDVACYVNFTRGDGTTDTLHGSFELCAGGADDASALIGARVTYTTEKGNVIAESCQGNPECPDHEEVDLVSSITAAD